MRFLLLLACTIFLVPLSFAQEHDDPPDEINARFEADNTIPYSGEPFSIHLRATYPAGFELIYWPLIEGQWGAFQILDAGPVIVEEISENIVQHQQTFTAVIWQPGDYVTPETLITYRQPNSVQASRLTVNEVFFTVPTVLETQDLGLLRLRPEKPPVSLFFVPFWFYVVAAISGLTIAYGGHRWWRRHKARQMKKQTADRIVLPFDTAVQALDSISTSQITAETLDQMASAMRRYLHDRFTIDMTGLTTAEIIAWINADSRFDGLENAPLCDLLKRADAAKFAGAVPEQETIESLQMAMVNWLMSVDHKGD